MQSTCSPWGMYSSSAAKCYQCVLLSLTLAFLPRSLQLGQVVNCCHCSVYVNIGADILALTFASEKYIGYQRERNQEQFNYNTGSAKTIMIFVSLSFIVQPVSNETVAKYSSISNELVACARAQVCIGTFSLLAQTQAHPP